ncbi:MAG: DUF2007 domain-containing protein [Bacteroidetes bacterium]|nr:DUF2007 domain-containing protein [Bacteroidota bacterium]
MEKDWEKVYSTSQAHQAEMIKTILEENEIECVLINRQDSFYKFIGELDLYVNRDKIIKAKTIINKFSSE